MSSSSVSESPFKETANDAVSAVLITVGIDLGAQAYNGNQFVSPWTLYREPTPESPGCGFYAHPTPPQNTLNQTFDPKTLKAS